MGKITLWEIKIINLIFFSFETIISAFNSTTNNDVWIYFMNYSEKSQNITFLLNICKTLVFYYNFFVVCPPSRPPPSPPKSNVKLCTLYELKNNYNIGSVELYIAHQINNHQLYIQKHKITTKMFNKEYQC